MNPSSFIHSLFGGEDGFLSLWRRDTKATLWANPNDTMVINQFAEAANADRFDAYLGVCLQREKPKSAKSRGTAAGASVMPGLWTDVDFASEAKATPKQKPKNYPTEAAAREAVGMMPVAPSIIIASGGGLHCYWLFDAPLVIDDANRAAAEALSKQWQQMLGNQLMEIGKFALDSTHDLARVLRLPGTPNTKHAGFVVGADSFPDADDLATMKRFTFGELETHVSKLAVGSNRSSGASKPNPKKRSPKKSAATSVPAFAIPGEPPILATADSNPPFDRFQNMCEAEPKFKATYDRKTQLVSPSEYDMTLANYCINAGWQPQETAALLVAFVKRQFPDHLEKLLRETDGWQDYLHRTIGKAFDKSRLEKSRQQSEAAIEELAAEVRRADEKGRVPNKQLILQRVSKLLMVDVLGFRQTGRENELYSLIIRRDNIESEVVIGGANHLRTPRRTLDRIMAHCQTFVLESKALRREWQAIVTALLSLVEVVEISESRLSERVGALLLDFLHSRSHRFEDGHGYETPRDATARDALAFAKMAFVWEKRLHVVARCLKNLARTVDPELAEGNKLFVGLKQLGFLQLTIQIQEPKTSRSYWVGAPTMSKTFLRGSDQDGDYDSDAVESPTRS